MKKDYDSKQQKRNRNYFQLNSIQNDVSIIRDSILTSNLIEDNNAKKTVDDLYEQLNQVTPIEPASPVSLEQERHSRRSSSSPSILSMKKAKTFKRRKFGAKKKKKDPFDDLVYSIPGMSRNQRFKKFETKIDSAIDSNASSKDIALLLKSSD